jgi:hypothetical protein
MWKVMIACVIMHNMIVKDERDDIICDQGWKFQGDLVEPTARASVFGTVLAYASYVVIGSLMIAFKPI